MHRFISIFLLSVFLAPSAVKMGMLVNFKINQDWISSVLCINKDEPITMCQGSCYLGEQLKGVDGDQKHTSPDRRPERVVPLLQFYLPTDTEPPSPSLTALPHRQQQLTDKQLIHSAGFLDPVFKPPRIIFT